MGRTINSSIIKERVADDFEKSRLSRQKLSIPNILVFHRAVYEIYLIRRVNSVKHKVHFNMLYHHKMVNWRIFKLPVALHHQESKI